MFKEYFEAKRSAVAVYDLDKALIDSGFSQENLDEIRDKIYYFSEVPKYITNGQVRMIAN